MNIHFLSQLQSIRFSYTVSLLSTNHTQQEKDFQLREEAWLYLTSSVELARIVLTSLIALHLGLGLNPGMLIEMM